MKMESNPFFLPYLEEKSASVDLHKPSPIQGAKLVCFHKIQKDRAFSLTSCNSVLY